MKTVDTNRRSIKLFFPKLLGFTDSFSFIIRNETEIGESLNYILKSLATYLYSVDIVSEWPGTKLLLDEASIFKYHLCIESILILSSIEDDIDKWLHPNLPEDIVLYKGDSPKLISVTYDKVCYFRVYDSEFEFINSTFKNIK